LPVNSGIEQLAPCWSSSYPRKWRTSGFELDRKNYLFIYVWNVECIHNYFPVFTLKEWSICICKKTLSPSIQNTFLSKILWSQFKRIASGQEFTHHLYSILTSNKLSLKKLLQPDASPQNLHGHAWFEHYLIDLHHVLIIKSFL